MDESSPVIRDLCADESIITDNSELLLSFKPLKVLSYCPFKEITSEVSQDFLVILFPNTFFIIKTDTFDSKN